MYCHKAYVVGICPLSLLWLASMSNAPRQIVHHSDFILYTFMKLCTTKKLKQYWVDVTNIQILIAIFVST